jgi:hypothetical protein
MATERSGATGGDGAQGAALGPAERMGALIRRAMSADDVRELEPGESRRAAAREGRRRHGLPQAAGGSGRSSGEPVASTRPGVTCK